MDVIPFIRFVFAVIIFGLAFYFLDVTLVAFVSLVPFEGDYASAMLSMWAILPAVVLFFAGIRLVMVMQKRTTY